MLKMRVMRVKTALIGSYQGSKVGCVSDVGAAFLGAEPGGLLTRLVGNEVDKAKIRLIITLWKV